MQRTTSSCSKLLLVVEHLQHQERATRSLLEISDCSRLLLQHKRLVVDRCRHLRVVRAQHLLPNLCGPRVQRPCLVKVFLERDEKVKVVSSLVSAIKVTIGGTFYSSLFTSTPRCFRLPCQGDQGRGRLRGCRGAGIHSPRLLILQGAKGFLSKSTGFHGVLHRPVRFGAHFQHLSAALKLFPEISDSFQTVLEQPCGCEHNNIQGTPKESM